MADDAVHRRDRKLLTEELFRVSALSNTFLLWAIAWGLFNYTHGLFSWMPFSRPILSFGLIAVAWTTVGAVHVHRAMGRAVNRRFISPRLRAQWTGCDDRLNRFREALRGLHREQIADFTEMPKTIEAVGQTLYHALRRADLVLDEISRSEGWLQGQAPPVIGMVGGVASHDPQAKELYRIADKNLAEYRANYAGVIAGVQRTEAQAAVFTTTLDTIRLKMLGYRLTGRRPDMSSQDLLEAMSEAKLQLKAIDSALEELELGPFPKMVATVADIPLAGPGGLDDAARARLTTPPPLPPIPQTDSSQRIDSP